MKIELSEVINHPIAEVFAFYADDHLENHPKWDSEMQLSLATDGAVGVGTVFNRRHTHFGEPVEGSMTVTEFYMNTADFTSAADIGRQLLELSEHDNSIRVDAHYVFGAATAFSGDLENGMPHLEKAIELHDPRTQGASRYGLGPNIGVVARVASGLTLWQCGSLDRAVARVSETLELARSIEHPYSVAYALYHNGFLALNRYRFEECVTFARELATVSSENDYLVWRTLATVLEGVAATALGDPERGLSMTEAAIDLYQGLTTPPVFWPLILTLRALVHALAGQPKRAVEIVDEAFDVGGRDNTMSPGLWIYRGDFLTMLPTPDFEAAEAAYQTAATGARAGELHLVELQALTRSVTARRQLGRTPDGADQLRELYDTFLEGFDEYDMIRARETLDQPPMPRSTE